MATELQDITILGSTGSIGTQTLDVVRTHAGRFRARILTAGRNWRLLAEQARGLRPDLVVIADESAYTSLRDALAGTGIEVAAGQQAIIDAASRLDRDIIVGAMVGYSGLRPTLAAIRKGKTIALANKETLVAGGSIVTEACRRFGATILPVDSEHSAIFQCLQGEDHDAIRKVMLTASGGPFRTLPRDRFGSITPAQALRHPNWDMGAKVTIDSASMMNKGLEIIEAHHLYGLPLERIGVLVHPQSLVHSLVEFEDGSLMAQAGTPDMRMPIAYCLAWPLCLDAGVPPLDLARSGALTFEEPDLHSFPCLELACRTIGKGSALPVALNAANEVAVEAFLSGRIGFMDIPDIIGRALDECSAPDPASLEAIETLDHETRLRVGLWIEKV